MEISALGRRGGIPAKNRNRQDPALQAARRRRGEAMMQAAEQAAPLSLTLPRKGGGNPSAGASPTSRNHAELTRRECDARCDEALSEVSALFRLPPPLRG